MTKDVKYEITSKIGIISGREYEWHKAINTVSWHNKPAKLDIRSWKQNSDGSLSMGKGLTFTDEEADNLVRILLNAGYGNPDDIQDILNKR